MDVDLSAASHPVLYTHTLMTLQLLVVNHSFKREEGRLFFFIRARAQPAPRPETRVMETLTDRPEKIEQQHRRRRSAAVCEGSARTAWHGTERVQSVPIPPPPGLRCLCDKPSRGLCSCVGVKLIEEKLWDKPVYSLSTPSQSKVPSFSWTGSLNQRRIKPGEEATGLKKKQP
ncbi:unnamed protein product [Pleuronectes platessa]|uniref:Uncharacterized protein n=1 Tax=Pleuronectes platessa TaxID=8262 RepID=A0A9N7VW24_PLEPL|nr:unnamed protein product [Pleuronectes platessa]